MSHFLVYEESTFVNTTLETLRVFFILGSSQLHDAKTSFYVWPFSSISLINDILGALNWGDIMLLSFLETFLQWRFAKFLTGVIQIPK